MFLLSPNITRYSYQNRFVEVAGSTEPASPQHTQTVRPHTPPLPPQQEHAISLHNSIHTCTPQQKKIHILKLAVEPTTISLTY
ncbi:hypothetical protein HanIR_Chr17g0882461 [Helianthus annuus]|nr:hypothetical protein HanIR_Chr17g0882461 [Helianthus annuus]